MKTDQPVCELCGHPMPEGEEMFKYHGYSGPCPASPIVKKPDSSEQWRKACEMHRRDLAKRVASKHELSIEAEQAIYEAICSYANPCEEIFRHKYLDPECVSKGCQGSSTEAIKAEEREKLEYAKRSRDWTHQWYAVRWKRLKDWFRNEGKDLPLAEEFWAIVANGHPKPTGDDPPTYDQILATKNWEIANLKKELATLKENS